LIKLQGFVRPEGFDKLKKFIHIICEYILLIAEQCFFLNNWIKDEKKFKVKIHSLIIARELILAIGAGSKQYVGFKISNNIYLIGFNNSKLLQNVLKNIARLVSQL
jgi:hypothetical protein